MDRPQRRSVGLSGHHVDLELSDSGDHRPRHLQPPAPSETHRDRSILVDLLKSFDASERADALIKEFGSVAGTLAAGPNSQARILGPGHPAIDHLTMIRRVMLQVLRSEAVKRPILSTSQALIDYLLADMAHLPVERMRILYLNARNGLLLDETMGYGSVKETPVYPREIMRRALEIGATALLLAHNHPSGDPTPSMDDIHATSNILAAARLFDIELHDHVILACSGWLSFRSLGLIPGA